MAEARPVEEQLLLQCARPSRTAANAERLRTLTAAPLSWTRLLDLAERHAMLPLVAHRVEALGETAGAPAEVHAELRTRFRRNAAQSLMLAAELPRLLAELGDAGVPALPWKGPLLAVDAYGNAALRRMRDLDVLVGGEMLDRARSVLRARGYRQYTPLLPRSLRLRVEYQCGMIRDADGAIVELHWRIAPPNVVAGPEFDELWGRRTSRMLNGVPMPGLSSEDRLVALCVHGSKHGWRRLEWIAAIAGISDDTACDWRVVVERATELRVRRMVRLGLILARDLLDARVDAAIAGWVDADPAAAMLATEVSRDLFAGSSAADADTLTSFQWRSQDTALGKLRFAAYWPLIRLGRRVAARVPRARS